MGEKEEAAPVLLQCLESGRVDVICSILSQMKNQADFHAQVDKLCCKEGTLLHKAVELDAADSVASLLAGGVNPCVQNLEGKTAYQCCKSDATRLSFVREALQSINMNKTERVCQLIRAGVPVDSVDTPQTKNTLLNWAADFATAEVVKALLTNGASVDLANSKDETPLHSAILKADPEVVKILLAAGANPSLKTKKGQDAFALAETHNPALLSLLSMDQIARDVRHHRSVDDMDDRMSLISCTETLNTQIFNDSGKYDKYKEGDIDSWTDLLWPQPKLISIKHQSVRNFEFPKDGKLKVYFDDCSCANPRQVMQIIELSKPLLISVGVDIEYRGHRLADHETSALEGKVTCGVFEDGRPSGSYTLTIDAVRGVEVVGSDYAGIRHAFATFVQIVRLHKYAQQKYGGHFNGVGSLPNTPNGNASGDHSLLNGSSSNKHLPDISSDGTIKELTIRDQPDRAFRAVYQDFSGCRILNPDTILKLATRLSSCKANYLFVNFEVRTTDRYQLPYTNRELFHMMQVCQELFITFVPSIDTQSNYLEGEQAKAIIEQFLDDFPLCKVVHFGPNLASLLIADRKLLTSIQRRVPRIYLSTHVDEKNGPLLSTLPAFVTLCVEGVWPFDVEQYVSPRVSIVIKFSTGDDGYLCAAPDSVAKKALLAAKLSDRQTVLGSMVCDLSTGCEAMPPSLSYMSLLASVGVAYNSSTDMKKYAFLLPVIAAHHMLLDGDMVTLFEQVQTLGKVEHQLTKYAYGYWKPNNSSSPNADMSSTTESTIFGMSPNKKMPISVFVEMILNPENMNMERLTPVVFKKARIELKRTSSALDAASKLLPYSYDLALVLEEIRLVTELMVLVSKLGQYMCVYGSQPIDRKKSFEEGLPYSPGRVGVINLPPAIRTDLANTMLRVRGQFQHVWLSRSIPSTLQNALKMFDNLFRALLPHDLQEMGKQLL
uniref:ANK_REP_REGION domain-containing protein n=1 Tax=Caenorhabditis tropicalis TaxID=1561998 RepID=A0A1I7TQL8_9PELO